MGSRGWPMIAKARYVTGVLFLAAATQWCSGCSLILVDGPPPKSQRLGSDFECTTTYGWTFIDLVLASMQAGGTIYAASRSDSDYVGLQSKRTNDIIAG